MQVVKLPKQTIDALLDGATIFYIPIELSGFSQAVGMTKEDIDDVVIKQDGTFSIYFKSGDSQTTKFQLQIGDNFFIQEDFLTYSNKSCLTYNPKLELSEGIKYRNDALDNGVDYPFDLDYVWKDASQMTLNQSRYKGTVVDIKFKNAKDIKTAREMEAILGTNYITSSGHIGIEEFSLLIDNFNQYLEKCKVTTFLFLYKIRKIEL